MPQQQYTKEEMWKLYEKLPQELKEAVFSQETADYIFNACERYGVNEVSKVASYVGLVLMGLLLPRDFQGALVKEVKIKNSAAQRIAQDLNRFVFYPVKFQLEQLHAGIGGEKKTEEIGVPTPRHSDNLQVPGAPLTPSQAVEPSGEQKPPTKQKIFSEEFEQQKQDTYREPAE